MTRTKKNKKSEAQDALELPIFAYRYLKLKSVAKSDDVKCDHSRQRNVVKHECKLCHKHSRGDEKRISKQRIVADSR